jgi:hypothetical protein
MRHAFVSKIVAAALMHQNHRAASRSCEKNNLEERNENEKGVGEEMEWGQTSIADRVNYAMQTCDLKRKRITANSVVASN